MDPRVLDFALCEEEKDHFERRGYLIVEKALPLDLVSNLERAVDIIWAQEKAAGLGSGQNLFYPNFVGREQIFIDLVDHPPTFAKVWGLLKSWNIYLYHSHLGVTPREPSEDPATPKTLGFHQDSGRVNAEIESNPRPMLSLKIGYWLSDVSAANRGNFYIIPGSHLDNELRSPSAAIPVLANAGDAVFFDRRLWHARSPNHSDQVRKVLFYGYGYRWLRTKDDMSIRPDLLASCTPIRRQLLGQGTNCNGFFSPKDEDVPLKGWLEEYQVEFGP